jgi:hypothetical protein
MSANRRRGASACSWPRAGLTSGSLGACTCICRSDLACSSGGTRRPSCGSRPCHRLDRVGARVSLAPTRSARAASIGVAAAWARKQASGQIPATARSRSERHPRRMAVAVMWLTRRSLRRLRLLDVARPPGDTRGRSGGDRWLSDPERPIASSILCASPTPLRPASSIARTDRLTAGRNKCITKASVISAAAGVVSRDGCPAMLWRSGAAAGPNGHRSR